MMQEVMGGLGQGGSHPLQRRFVSKATVKKHQEENYNYCGTTHPFAWAKSAIKSDCFFQGFDWSNQSGGVAQVPPRLLAPYRRKSEDSLASTSP